VKRTKRSAMEWRKGSHSEMPIEELCKDPEEKTEDESCEKAEKRRFPAEKKHSAGSKGYDGSHDVLSGRIR
jgi:hypothetical protein